jgi:hypothetical protein
VPKPLIGLSSRSKSPLSLMGDGEIEAFSWTNLGASDHFGHVGFGKIAS